MHACRNKPDLCKSSAVLNPMRGKKNSYCICWQYLQTLDKIQAASSKAATTEELSRSKSTCNSLFLQEWSKDPAMTLSLPMEHFTSNSGQILKYHLSLARTPRQERTPAGWYVTKGQVHTWSYFLLKCLQNKESSPWRHFHTRIILCASSGNDSKCLDLKIPNIPCR